VFRAAGAVTVSDAARLDYVRDIHPFGRRTMRVLKLLLILPVIFMALPARAADAKTGASTVDKARTENVEPQNDQSSSDPAERPKREAVKMSPTIRVSPPRPDESGKMRRVAPARADSPLLNVPLPQGSEIPGGH
jgi:hypothetical protein